MSKKGWRLDFIGYYYRFSHDEHVYKYQIDYTPSSSEYNEVLKEISDSVFNAFSKFRLFLVSCSVLIMIYWRIWSLYCDYQQLDVSIKKPQYKECCILITKYKI